MNFLDRLLEVFRKKKFYHSLDFEINSDSVFYNLDEDKILNIIKFIKDNITDDGEIYDSKNRLKKVNAKEFNSLNDLIFEIKQEVNSNKRISESNHENFHYFIDISLKNHKTLWVCINISLHNSESIIYPVVFIRKSLNKYYCWSTNLTL